MLIYNARGTVGQQNSGSITLTGPGGGTSVGLGIVLEFGSVFQTGSTNSITITGVQYGILVNNNGAFVSYGGTATISITNSTTPTASAGISTSSGGAYDATGTSLTLTHFTTCVSAAGNSIMANGGSESLSSCGTNQSAIQGSQILLF
jgi:hypothetical protein